MCSSAVVRRLCGRRYVRKLAVWVVVVGGLVILSLNYSKLVIPAEDGNRGRREMMDGNDDGKMMGGVDNEGESKIEINNKPKSEGLKVISKTHEQNKDDGADDGDGDEKTDYKEEENGDEETNSDEDYEANDDNPGQKFEMVILEKEGNDIENARVAEEKDEKKKEGKSKTGNNGGLRELKQYQEKTHDEPEVEKKNVGKNTSNEGKKIEIEEKTNDEEGKIKEKDGENEPGGNEKENEEKKKKEENEKKAEGREIHPWVSPLALSGNFAPNETLNGQPVVKVLLLAYQRSGSSYTGELVSSSNGSLYVYEPLFKWRHQFGYAPDSAFQEDVAKLLGDLLDCSPKVMSAWSKVRMWWYFRKTPERAKDFCKEASMRVVKTIRARKAHVMPWLLQRQDIKVVHLVRDPRGVLNSVKYGGNMWTDNNRDAAVQCDHLKTDLTLQHLGPQRYLRVRYEDLVEKPMEETKRVFSFLGVPLSPPVLSFLKQHTGLSSGGSHLQQRYMNTYRNPDFRHDHWKDELDKDHLQQIQNVCREMLSVLQYPIL